jgi:hypothetical protein
LLRQAGDLIAHRDVFFGQSLEAPVICHVLLHLSGLVGRNALGKLFAVKEALEDVIGAVPGGGGGRAGFKELLAQGAAAKAVNGLHLQQDGLPLLKKIIKIQFHGAIVSIQIQQATRK